MDKCDKTQEELQWNAYKNSLLEKKKFLRSKWKNNIREQISKDENVREIQKSANITKNNNSEKTIISKKRREKKIDQKFKIQMNKVNLCTNLNTESSITKKASSKFIKLKKSCKSKYIINFKKNMQKIQINSNSYFNDAQGSREINDFINEYEYNFDILPYEIIPSDASICNSPYSFTLFNKLKYNKILPKENFIGRLALVKPNIIDEYKFVRIKNILEDGILELSELKLDKDEKIASVDDTVANIISRQVYLIEYFFNYDSENKYALIITKFESAIENRSLLIQENYNYKREKTQYSGFILDSEFNLCGQINAIDPIKLSIINPSNLNSIGNNFFEKINKKFKFFLKEKEYEEGIYLCINNNIIPEVLTNNLTILNGHLLHELFIINKLKSTYTYKMCLLLQCNMICKSIYIKNYNSGVCEWISLEIKSNNLNTKAADAIDEINININLQKGTVSLSSLVALTYANKFSYRNLNFNKFNVEGNASGNGTVIIIPKYSNGVSIMNEIECNICTYKIGDFEYCLCKFCSKIFHIGCLSPNEQQRQSVCVNGNNMLNTHENNYDYWACVNCKPCRNCHSKYNRNSTLNLECKFLKLICNDCNSAYHLECIEPSISKYFPLPGDIPKLDKWKCENCLKCINCNATIKDKVKFSLNYDSCSRCEKRLEKKEFCPICMKLWNDLDEKNMIECKCKFWIHKECDRLLTNKNYKKMTKKIYLCPICRIYKKNVVIKNILTEIIKQDKNEYFYYPVDTNSVKNYLKIISNPICFSDIETKVEKNVYLENIDEFFSDIRLIFMNATNYNMPASPVYKNALQLQEICEQYLSEKKIELYQVSFEYFIFDCYNNYMTSSIRYEFFPYLEEKIISKFSDKFEIMRPKMKSFINKVNDYKITWEFINRILFDHYSISLNIEDDKDLEITLNENENISLKYQTDSINDTETKNENSLHFNNNKNDFEFLEMCENINEDNNLNVEIEIQNHQEIQIFSKDSYENLNKNMNFSTNYENHLPQNNDLQVDENIGRTSSMSKIKINCDIFNEPKPVTCHSNLNSRKIQINVDDNNLIINDTNPVLSSDKEVNNKEENEIVTFNKKKRERVKLKQIKACDFQLELDTYHSNFEIDRKIPINNNKLTSSRINTKHKMEIIENLIDVENLNLALEEEEDKLIKDCERLKSKDPKFSFLYSSKYKLYIDEKNKREQSAYVDMINSYISLKDNQRKKSMTGYETNKNLKASASTSNNEEKISVTENDELYEYPMIKPKSIANIVKNKKGRPSKKTANLMQKLDEGKNSFSKTELTPVPKLKIESQTNEKVSVNVNNSENETQRENTILKNKNNLGKFQAESELFDENINQSLLPLPAMICFSPNLPELILEKNCYVCGSFDDTNLFLTCSICFEHFHSYCISNSPSITQNVQIIKNYNWKCQNCKLCENCNTNINDNLLLYCDSCDRALHTYCLKVKLLVVPESGWKCLSCFKCQNCSTTKYYGDNFPINPNKDYSIFTRNFSYCFECGLRHMYSSFCYKCQTSDFKKLNQNLILIKAIHDYKKFENIIELSPEIPGAGFNSSVETGNTIMLNCGICNNWFHSQCLGFDGRNLKYYFDEFEIFNCLDCYLLTNYNHKYQEVTFIKYLDVLKMGYTVMCFSKMIMIILKSICRDSSIKLHSKLLNIYLKENFNSLINDKNICMMLELIRTDVFLLKNRKSQTASNKKKSKHDTYDPSKESTNNFKIDKPEINNNNTNNLKFSHGVNIIDNMISMPIINSKQGRVKLKSEINFEIKSNNFNKDNYCKSQPCVINIRKIEKEVSSSHYQTLNFDSNYLQKILRMFEFQKNRKFSQIIKNSNKLIYDINWSKRKNLFSTKGVKLLSQNLLTDFNTLIIKTILLKKKHQNFHDATSTSINYPNNTDETKIVNENDHMNNNSIINDSVGSQMINKENTDVGKYSEQMKKDDMDVVIELEDFKKTKLESEKKFVESVKLEVDDDRELVTNKRKIKSRLSLISDRKLKEELDNFFKINSDMPLLNGDLLEKKKLVNFYKFNLEDYYKSGNGYINSSVNSTDQTTKIESNKLITETIEKLIPYMKSKKFNKLIEDFLFNLIITIIISLKQSLLKWLINHIVNFNTAEYVNESYQKSKIYQLWVNHHSDNINTDELNEDEINKLLEIIDPIVDSPSRNFNCEFCTRKGARKFSGRLIYIKGVSWGHINCMLWSRGIQESSEGNLLNVCQMIHKLRLFKCCFCKKYGGTISCDSRKCGRNYHFTCAHLKQGVFTQNKQFYCNRCALSVGNTKIEYLEEFRTDRRFIVVRNPEFITDNKLVNFIPCNIDNENGPNIFKILPKYQVGLCNKIGNTTILKFLKVNKTQTKIENFDIGIVKYIEKKNKKNSFPNNIKLNNNLIPSSSPDSNLFILMINETGVYFSNLNFNKNSIGKFENFLHKSKLLNCVEKTTIDLESIKSNSYNNEYIVMQNEFNLTFDKDKFDFFNGPIIKKLNNKLENILKQSILSEDEYESNKRINENMNDWMCFFNISLPFNILMKHHNLYAKMTTEFSENISSCSYGNEILDLRNKRESKNKLENYVNLIKNKNSSSNLCFKIFNYIERHKQSKIFKKALVEQDNGGSFLGQDNGKKNNKQVNNQMYKNLNKTMSTNIMEVDLPLSMKFRNYKSLKPRVTIGPSSIHRNGLYTIDSFQIGEIVIEYVGELITNKIADYREKEYNLKGFGDCYMFRLDQNYIIDATKYGNLARFINHCCEPNCSAQANLIGEKKHIILYAKRAIKANEEITYDYNFECEQEKIMCRCGAPNCQGRLN